MCGIVGVVADRSLNRAEKVAFAWMLYFCRVRGVHGTGVFWEDRYNVLSAKTQGSPETLYRDFDDSFDLDGVLKDDVKYVVGHTRQKTVGVMSEANAHPFFSEDSSVIGVHNGTVLNKRTQLPRFNHFPVDSQAVINSFAEGWDIAQLEGKTETDFAIVYRDSSDSTLHIARNDYRPLHYAKTKAGQVLFFASEPFMIRRAFAAARVTGEIEVVHELPAGEEWIFDLDTPKVLSTLTKVNFELTRRGAGFQQQQHNRTGRGAGVSPHHVPKSAGARQGTYANRVEPPKHWTDKQWDTALACGCALCGDNLDKSDFEPDAIKPAVFFHNLEMPLCGNCHLEGGV